MKNFKKFIYFCVMGSIGALIELGVFNLLYIYLSFEISKLVGLATALSLNFSLNRNITFSANNKKKSTQIFRYAIVYFIAILTNYSISVFLKHTLGCSIWSANLSVIAGIIAGIPITFFGSLYWVFNTKK